MKVSYRAKGVSFGSCVEATWGKLSRYGQVHEHLYTTGRLWWAFPWSCRSVVEEAMDERWAASPRPHWYHQPLWKDSAKATLLFRRLPITYTRKHRKLMTIESRFKLSSVWLKSANIIDLKTRKVVYNWLKVCIESNLKSLNNRYTCGRKSDNFNFENKMCDTVRILKTGTKNLDYMKIKPGCGWEGKLW